MFTVYVLYSQSYKKIYVGYTSNLEERFKSHNEVATKGWAIKFRPWEIVHSEIFEIKADAMRREKELKSAKGRVWIWQVLGDK